MTFFIAGIRTHSLELCDAFDILERMNSYSLSRQIDVVFWAFERARWMVDIRKPNRVFIQSVLHAFNCES